MTINGTKIIHFQLTLHHMDEEFPIKFFANQASKASETLHFCLFDLVLRLILLLWYHMSKSSLKIPNF